jgi:ADP-ribose pyrophosphatase
MAAPVRKSATKSAATKSNPDTANPTRLDPYKNFKFRDTSFGRPKSSLKAKLVSSDLAYQGKVFNVYKDTVIEPGGHENTRDVIRHNGSVVILAVDDSKYTRDPEIILERQYRHAAGQFLIELPAGRIEPGEKPLAAAKREMIEETGYRAKQWTLLTKYFASPGFLGEWMQIYLARDIREGLATPEQDEHIEIHRIRLSEAMRLIATNQIHDGKTIIGLSLYDAARRAKRL